MSMHAAVVAPDTDGGKTVVTAALFSHLCRRGRAAVMKPLQTGADMQADPLHAPDLDVIYSTAGITPPPAVSPHVSYLFGPACSPHLAAAKANTVIRKDKIRKDFNSLRHDNDFVLVETAGGILSPVTETLTVRGLITYLSVPVIMVIPNTLGAISQSLSALEAVRAADIPLLGVISKEISPCRSELEHEIIYDNIRTIEKLGHIHITGHLPFCHRPEDVGTQQSNEVTRIIEELIHEYRRIA
ncbi:MAG: dethiobiotin synthase [Fibrobacterota bacterium]